jgi:adenylate cyclase
MSTMATEIERKFLVRDDAWRNCVSSSDHLTDGLIASVSGRKVRVRLCEHRATIAIKSKKIAGVREEFEYEIPKEDAAHLLGKHCDGLILEKMRHYVEYAGYTWQVDVYEGRLTGVIIAEVELPHPGAALLLPPWVGEETTGRPEFRKINMVKARLSDHRD